MGRALAGLDATAEAVTGRPLSDLAREQFKRYLDLLVAWNRAQRLTGYSTAAEMVRGIFEDSLLWWPLLPPRPCRMVDIGAGAGVPGLPLRIVDAGIGLTLIEAMRKRVSFLKAVQRDLGLDEVAIVEGRAEALAAGRSLGQFDVAVARGVGPLDELTAVAMSLLRPGGVLVAAGPPPAEGRAASKAGSPVVQIVRYQGLERTRAFVVVHKERDLIEHPHFGNVPRGTW